MWIYLPLHKSIKENSCKPLHISTYCVTNRIRQLTLSTVKSHKFKDLHLTLTFRPDITREWAVIISNYRQIYKYTRIVGGVNEQNSIANKCLCRWLDSRKSDHCDHYFHLNFIHLELCHYSLHHVEDSYLEIVSLRILVASMLWNGQELQLSA